MLFMVLFLLPNKSQQEMVCIGFISLFCKFCNVHLRCSASSAVSQWCQSLCFRTALAAAAKQSWINSVQLPRHSYNYTTPTSSSIAHRTAQQSQLSFTRQGTAQMQVCGFVCACATSSSSPGNKRRGERLYSVVYGEYIAQKHCSRRQCTCQDYNHQNFPFCFLSPKIFANFLTSRILLL